MITLTNEAAKKITELLRERGVAGIRIGVQTTGCSGYAYVLEWTNGTLESADVIFRDKGVELVVDKKWSNMLWGTQLDYKKEGLQEGFEFNNPNEKARCGCGESFTV